MSQSEPRGLPEANQASNINSKGTRKRRKRRGGKQGNVHRKQVQRGKARAKLLYQTRLSNQSSDNSDYGDMMRKKPNNKSFRIQFQNRNGWRPKHKFSDIDEVCYYARQSQADSLLIAEHCLSWEKGKVSKVVNQII